MNAGFAVHIYSSVYGENVKLFSGSANFSVFKYNRFLLEIYKGFIFFFFEEGLIFVDNSAAQTLPGFFPFRRRGSGFVPYCAEGLPPFPLPRRGIVAISPTTPRTTGNCDLPVE